MLYSLYFSLICSFLFVLIQNCLKKTNGCAIIGTPISKIQSEHRYIDGNIVMKYTCVKNTISSKAVQM